MSDTAKIRELFESSYPELYAGMGPRFSIPSSMVSEVLILSQYIVRTLNNARIPMTDMKVRQVKTKFGSLRFYYDIANQEPSEGGGYSKFIAVGEIKGMVGVTEALSHHRALDSDSNEDIPTDRDEISLHMSAADAKEIHGQLSVEFLGNGAVRNMVRLLGSELKVESGNE